MARVRLYSGMTVVVIMAIIPIFSNWKYLFYNVDFHFGTEAIETVMRAHNQISVDDFSYYNNHLDYFYISFLLASANHF